MDNREAKQNTVPVVRGSAPAALVAPSAQPPRRFQRGGQGGGYGGQRGYGGGGRGGGKFAPRQKSEFDQKLVDVKRVARVVAGGRRFSFWVALVAGDKKGRVGVGVGKGGDTAAAIEKAMRAAKKNMIKIKTTETMSIAHEVRAKYSSARIMIKPAPGRGLVAGSAVRNVLDLAGVRDVNAKIMSPSKNKLNIARAAIEALSSL